MRQHSQYFKKRVIAHTQTKTKAFWWTQPKTRSENSCFRIYVQVDIFKVDFVQCQPPSKNKILKVRRTLRQLQEVKNALVFSKYPFFNLMVLGITEIFSSISLLLDIFQHFSFISFGTWTLLVNKINCESFGLLQLVLLQYHRNKIN